jgi:hypothetical protein
VAAQSKLAGSYSPALETASYWERRGADEWRLATRSEAERSDPISFAEVRLNIDGRGQLFSNRAADMRTGEGPLLIIENLVAGTLEAFFAVMGAVYLAAGYYGQVDVGVAITGIEGAGSLVRWNMGDDFAYSAPTFTRTASVPAVELERAAALAHQLLRHFYEATTGIEDYNPFER